MMKLLLLSGYFAFMIWVFWMSSRKIVKTQKKKSDAEEQSGMVDIDKLDEISETKDNIKLLTDMIADVESCSPDNLIRTITVTVNEYQREYTFTVNGQDDASDNLVNLFWYERDKLNTSLRENIRKIQ
jgi:hypothetical protein